MDFEVTYVMHIIIYSLNLSVALFCILILLIELKVTHKKHMNMEVKMTRRCRQSGLFSSKVTICWNQSKVSGKTKQSQHVKHYCSNMKTGSL